MSFIKRLGYYLGGFSVGLIFLFFFFNGKRTECSYSPDARVKKDIKQKEWVFESDFYQIQDTVRWFSASDINFGKSTIGTDSCNLYVFEFEAKIFTAENCPNKVFFRR